MDGANEVKRGHDVARMQKGLLILSRKDICKYIYIYYIPRIGEVFSILGVSSQQQGPKTGLGPGCRYLYIDTFHIHLFPKISVPNHPNQNHHGVFSRNPMCQFWGISLLFFKAIRIWTWDPRCVSDCWWFRNPACIRPVIWRISPNFIRGFNKQEVVHDFFQSCEGFWVEISWDDLRCVFFWYPRSHILFS